MYGPAYPMSHRSPRYERVGDPWQPKILRVAQPGRRRRRKTQTEEFRAGEKPILTEEYSGGRGSFGRKWRFEGDIRGRGAVRRSSVRAARPPPS